MGCTLKSVMAKIPVGIKNSKLVDNALLEAYIKQELNGGAKTSITTEQRSKNAEAVKKLLTTGDAELAPTQDKSKLDTLMKTREKSSNESANGKTTVKVVKVDYKTPDTDNSVNVLRKYGAEKDKHYGNPFGANSYGDKAEVPNQGTDTEVSQKYEDWLKGTYRQDVAPERRNWIVEQIKSGKLDGKELMYFRDAGDNHAKRLAELVNNKSWIKNAVNNNNNRFIDNFISPEDLYIYDSDNTAYDDEGEQINITHANDVKWFNNIIDKLGLPEDVVSIMKETLPLLNGIPTSSELAPRAEATKKLDKLAKFILNRLLSPNEQILWNNLEKLSDLGNNLLMALDIYTSHPEYKKNIEEYFKMFKSIYGSTETDKLKTVLKSKNLDLINSTLLKYDRGLTETYQNKFKYKEFLFTEAGDQHFAIRAMGDAISVAFRLVAVPELSDTKGTNTEFHKLNRKSGEDLAKRRAKFLNLFIQVMRDTTNKKSTKPIDIPTNEQYEKGLVKLAQSVIGKSSVIDRTHDSRLRKAKLAGQYGNGVVYLRKEDSNDAKNYTKAHELLHAITVDWLNNNKNSELYKDLDKLFKDVKKEVLGNKNYPKMNAELLDKKGVPYWSTDKMEFIAEVLAKPELQAELSKMKYELKHAKSALGKFVQLVTEIWGKAFNLESDGVLQELVGIVDNVVEKGIKSEWKPGSRKAHAQPSNAIMPGINGKAKLDIKIC